MNHPQRWIEAAETCEKEAARLLEGAKQWRENAANGVPHPYLQPLNSERIISADELQQLRAATQLSGVRIGT